MDILKIRKRAQEQKAATAAAERVAHPTPLPAPEPAPTAAERPRPPPEPELAVAPPITPPSAAERAAPAPVIPPAPPAAPAVATAPPPSTAAAPAPVDPGPARGAPPEAEPRRAAAPSARPPAANRAHAPLSADERRAKDPLGEFLAYYDELSEIDEPEGPTTEVEALVTKRYLAFDLADEAYAVSILDIREILKTFAVTTVPRAPRAVLGVLSKRGVVMPVLDLAACLSLREPDPTIRSEQRILVVGDGDSVCGLRVDRVHSVVQLPTQGIEPVPGGLDPRTAALLSGLGRDDDRLYIILEVESFLAFLHGYVESPADSALQRRSSLAGGRA